MAYAAAEMPQAVLKPTAAAAAPAGCATASTPPAAPAAVNAKTTGPAAPVATAAAASTTPDAADTSSSCSNSNTGSSSSSSRAAQPPEAVAEPAAVAPPSCRWVPALLLAAEAYAAHEDWSQAVVHCSVAAEQAPDDVAITARLAALARQLPAEQAVAFSTGGLQGLLQQLQLEAEMKLPEVLRPRPKW